LAGALKRSMFKYDIQPFDLILQAVNELYPGFESSISFLPEEEFLSYLIKKTEEPIYGVTLFTKDLPPLVLINAITPVMHCVEIIAHEVAHVVAGVRAGHGEKWQKEFDKIYDKYCELHNKVCEEIKKETDKMAKDKNIKKESKKAPKKTKEEKRQEKREKKNK